MPRAARPAARASDPNCGWRREPGKRRTSATRRTPWRSSRTQNASSGWVEWPIVKARRPDTARNATSRGPLARQRERTPVLGELRGDLAEHLEHRVAGGRAVALLQCGGPQHAHGRALAERADDDVVAHGDQRQVGNERRAHARRDEPLDGEVVVAVEDDVRLEPGELAGAQEDRHVRAAARGAEDPLLAGELLELEVALARERVAFGQRDVHRIVERVHPLADVVLGRAEAGRDVEDDGGLPGAELRDRRLGLRRLERELDARMA